MDASRDTGRWTVRLFGPRPVALCLIGLLAAGLTALSSTAEGEPACHSVVFGLNAGSDDVEQACRDTNEQVSERNHKERAYWEQIAGAPHQEMTPIKDSGTPATVDLFAIRQRNAQEALAGGAICEEEEAGAQTGSCKRVPVMYSVDEDHPWHEDEAFRAEGEGYVGGIAWIGRGRALAVGGSGTYPQRESNPIGEEWEYDARAELDRNQGAGDARAWLLQSGEWQEISEELPADMGGLSALDIWVGREADGDEWGLAGDYGHIWEWEGGTFTGSKLDRESPGIGAEDPDWAVVDGPLTWTESCSTIGDTRDCTWNPSSQRSNPESFQFRVREIRIAPDRGQKRAFAVTAGCCGTAAATSQLIEYVPEPRKNASGVAPPEAPDPEDRPRWLVPDRTGATYPDSAYSFAVRPDRYGNFYGSNDDFGEPQPDHGTPTWQVDSAAQVVTAPGGPAGEEEPATRYVGADGDSEIFRPNNFPEQPVRGNGVPDWKVGATASGAATLATTVGSLRPEYGGIRPYCEPTGGGRIDGDELSTANGGRFIPTEPSFNPAAIAETRVCRPEQVQSGTFRGPDPEGPIRTRESGTQTGPSWGLNAIDLLDADSVGYAVGDRGAILRYGVPANESDPPSLGQPKAAKLGDRSAYEEKRPDSADEVGDVPPLASRHRERVDDPRMVRGGSPDGNQLTPDAPVQDARTIVMSRDGSEGWAVGPSPEAQGSNSLNSSQGLITLYHYDAGRWTSCDSLGLPGILEPDAACESLGGLYKRRTSGQDAGRIRLDVAARIPLENDSDPSNDDEFEVIAIGNPLEKEGFPSTVIRYRDGRWHLEDIGIRRSLNARQSNSLRSHSLACVGPDECWLTATAFGSATILRRFDGERWIDCTRAEAAGSSQTSLDNRVACGDLGDRVAAVNTIGGALINVTSAGDRVFLAGGRADGQKSGSLGNIGIGGLPKPNEVLNSQSRPVILYKDRGADTAWESEDGGYDRPSGDTGAAGGTLVSLAVARRADGRFEGWGVLSGGFVGGAKWPLLHLDPASGEWDLFKVQDAASDTLGSGYATRAAGVTTSRQVSLPGQGDELGLAYISTRTADGGSFVGAAGDFLVFNPKQKQWELAERPGAMTGSTNYFNGNDLSNPGPVAADGRGGIWAAFRSGSEIQTRAGLSETYFYNYTREPPREVFDEVSHPMAGSENLTDLAGSRDGSVWLSTDQGALYRHDRIGGWERVTVPGWDPGRVVTHRSPINAVALAPDGTGLAVGKSGRIANLSSAGVRLDRAAGTVCQTVPEPPCGTSFDLQAAAVAPGGAALAGGKKLTLLWRPQGGEFQKIKPPDAPSFATITGIAMPSAEQAWVALDSGQIFAGTGDGSGRWRWRLDNGIDVNGQDRLLSEDQRGEPVALQDIAVNGSGDGIAVGDRGVILERAEGRSPAWRRVRSGATEQLTSVAQGLGGGGSAIAGGENGLILTRAGGAWQLARPGDQLRPDDGAVIGVAVLPGVEDGQVEAWAGSAAPRSSRGGLGDFRTDLNQLHHFTNAPDEPLLNQIARSNPLPDVPRPREGELSFAAFGRSDCHMRQQTALIPCQSLKNGSDLEQSILRRVRDEVLERSKEPGGPQFAIFTGDAYDSANGNGGEAVEQNSRLAGNVAQAAPGAPGVILHFETGGEKYRRLNEQLFDWLPDRGLPLFAPIGGRDLSETRGCATTTVSIHCADNRDRARAGDNLVWRQAMEERPAPWGSGEPAKAEDLLFNPIGDGPLTTRAKDTDIDDPTDEVPETELPEGEVPETQAIGNVKTPPVQFGGKVGGREEAGDLVIPTGGASTHYAADIERNGEPAARLIVVDTSLGSLTASDPIQQPVEPDGGQATWLERVLCIKGSTTDAGQCTREPGQQAIVVSNTPTYSYGPTDPTENQADAAVFESILFRHRANVVVAGKLGWNGRYWATAPGIHEPCPAGDYAPDEAAPEPASQVCNRDAQGSLGGDPAKLVGDAQRAASDLLGDSGSAGVIPFVVASGAGGRFNEFADRGGQTDGDRGFWRGYSIIRLDPSGDNRRTIVEQRPVFDWIGLTGTQRVLRPRQRLALKGRGREPMGSPPPEVQMAVERFDEINSPGITHRYDLVYADPDKPWVPLAAEDAGDRPVGPGDCAPYVCVPESVGTIDRQSGQIRAGNGEQPRTYAIAMLSVGDMVATYPLAFEPRPSFSNEPPVPPPPPPPPPPPAAPAPSPPSQFPTLNLPTPPALPGLPIAVELQPPAPPVPPPPPGAASVAPLNLFLNTPGINIAPQSTVVPPPAPPIQPAPPGGARKEARQRQAAAQKSGSEATEEGTEHVGDEMRGSAGDLGMSRRENNATRLAAPAPGQSFTPLTHRSQPSAWATSLQWGGGMTLMALVLAFGWTTLRPTPRNRVPEVPAPAWARYRGHPRR